MNYLAHIHIAEHTSTSLLGNFLGDFVKGNPDGLFNKKVEQGIRLHRFVDSYTDTHPLVKSVKPLFPKSLRRFAPISLDMFWDHCLAKHWSMFYEHSLADFTLQAEGIIASEKIELVEALPEQFEKVSRLVWKGKWFEHYGEIANIEFALQRIASSRERMKPLADTFSSLSEHYELLSETFFKLYPDILACSLLQTKKETK